MRIFLTPEAKSDINQSVAWYRERSIQASGNFLLAVNVAFTKIEMQPTAQVVVDAETGTRRALLWKYPHRVLYLIDGDQIVVFAVMHHRRDELAWRGRLEGRS